MAATFQSRTEACANLRKALEELKAEPGIAGKALELAVKALELYADPQMWEDGQGLFLYRYDAGNIARRTVEEILKKLEAS